MLEANPKTPGSIEQASEQLILQLALPQYAISVVRKEAGLPLSERAAVAPFVQVEPELVLDFGGELVRENQAPVVLE